MGIVQCDGVVIVVVSEHGGGLVRESSLGLCESTKGLVCNVAGSDGEFVVVTGRGEARPSESSTLPVSLDGSL